MQSAYRPAHNIHWGLMKVGDECLLSNPRNLNARQAVYTFARESNRRFKTRLLPAGLLIWRVR